MNVVLTVGGEIVVDDQGDLLDIDTTGQKVSGDQDTGGTGTELLHDNVTLALLHVTVHGGDSEVTGSELVGKPVDLAAGVAEDNGLGDGDGLVEIGQSVELPLLLLNGNVELLDTLKGEFLLLNQDTDGVTHELGGDLQDVLGHGGGQKGDLGGLGQKLEDVVDLLGETTGQHLISLIEDEQLHCISAEDATLDHVLNTTGGTDNDVGTVTESGHILTDVGTTDTGVALQLHEVTNGNNDLLDLLGQLTGRSKDQSLAGLDVDVDLLEGGDGEGSGLTGTGLGLSDNIVTCIMRMSGESERLNFSTERKKWLTLDDGHDGALLDSRGTLETVGVNT